MKIQKKFISILLTATLMFFAGTAQASFLGDLFGFNDNVGGTQGTLPVRNFLGLTDTPDTYSGQGGKTVSVKSDASGLEFSTISSMTYPGAGIPLSTGSAWGTSITNNSDNWNTAYSWGNHALAGYLTSLSGAVLTDQTVGQTIGATGARLTKLWATDVTVTNAITGSVTGNAGTVTNGVYTTSDATALAATSVGNKDKYLHSNASTGVLEWSTVAGSGATTALDNLSSVAINTALVPATAGGIDFGSTTKPWGDLWLAGTSLTPGTNQFKITGASTSGVRTITLPDRSLTLDNITTATTTAGTGFLKGNGSVISFDNSTYLTSVGTGVANEITYWSGTNALGSLATATYPSLTELSYVKGVTSAIQTQLNAKGVGDMTLAGVQSVTGAKTFDKDKILMKGTSTGVTTFSTANAGATSYTQTFPARDGTVANLDNVLFVGTTSIALNRTTASQTLTGVSIDGTAGKATNMVGGNGTTLLGSIGYQSNTDTTTMLGPNTTTTKKFLTMTGDGTNGVAPGWNTILAADVPTLNQSTTGSAATLTTPRAIYGNNFDGSAALTQIIASTYGGTGNGFTKFSGPATTEKTFTLPNVSATILTSNDLVTLAQGGTNANLTASNGGIFYSTASAGAILAGTATANKMLLSGSSTTPTWSTSTIPTSAGATANKVLLSDGTNYVLSTPTFPNASATSGKVIKSDGTNWVASTETYAAPGTSGNVLTSDGTNWTSAAPSGGGTLLASGYNQVANAISVETTLATYTIPANKLGTNKGIRLKAGLKLDWNGNGGFITINVKLGGTTMSSFTYDPAGVPTETGHMNLETNIIAAGATNSQYWNTSASMSGTTAETATVQIAFGNKQSEGSLAKDSTGALDLIITATHESSSASLTTTLNNYTVEYLQ